MGNVEVYLENLFLAEVVEMKIHQLTKIDCFDFRGKYISFRVHLVNHMEIEASDLNL